MIIPETTTHVMQAFAVVDGNDGEAQVLFALSNPMNGANYQMAVIEVDCVGRFKVHRYTLGSERSVRDQISFVLYSWSRLGIAPLPEEEANIERRITVLLDKLMAHYELG